MTQVTYYGHSCFMVETKGKKLLFDPFITPNSLANEINFNEILCDFIFVSHGHEDHCADLEALAKKTKATVIGSWELHSWLNNKNINTTHPMNLGGKRDFDFGNVKMVYAAHSNSLPDGTYGGTAAGYVIKNDEICFYYAGDTALTNDMNLIGEMYKLDFAFLPIGSNFTMDASDAAIASKFINCKNIIGMHYDTFGYIKIDHNEAINEFAKNNSKLTLMKIGETIKIK